MTDFVDTGVLYPDHDTDATSVALCRRHDVDAILRTLDSILLIADLVQPVMSEIVSTEDTLGGAPRIEGRRIGVHHVAKRVIDAGEPPEQVAADYDPDEEEPEQEA